MSKSSWRFALEMERRRFPLTDDAINVSVLPNRNSSTRFFVRRLWLAAYKHLERNRQEGWAQAQIHNWLVVKTVIFEQGAP